MEQERLKEEEEARRSKKENTPKGKQQTVERGETKSKTLPGDPKSRAGTADSPAKSPTESVTEVDSVELHPTEERIAVKDNTHRKRRLILSLYV